MQQTTPKLSGLKQYHLLFVMSLSGVDWVFLLIGAYLADLSYTHISDLLASQLGRLSFPHRSHIPPAANLVMLTWQGRGAGASKSSHAHRQSHTAAASRRHKEACPWDSLPGRCEVANNLPAAHWLRTAIGLCHGVTRPQLSFSLYKLIGRCNKTEN